MAKMSIEDWKMLKLTMGVIETPRSIGSMLFKMLEDSGYTVEETLTVARTLFHYAIRMPKWIKTQCRFTPFFSI